MSSKISTLSSTTRRESPGGSCLHENVQELRLIKVYSVSRFSKAARKVAVRRNEDEIEIGELRGATPIFFDSDSFEILDGRAICYVKYWVLGNLSPVNCDETIDPMVTSVSIRRILPGPGVEAEGSACDHDYPHSIIDFIWLIKRLSRFSRSTRASRFCPSRSSFSSSSFHVRTVVQSTLRGRSTKNVIYIPLCREIEIFAN